MTDFDVQFSVAGSQGPQGAYTVHLFLQAAAKPVAPTDITWAPVGGISSNNAAGWSPTAPSSGTDPIWRISSYFDPSAESSISTWGPVLRYSIPETAADLASAQTTDLRATTVQGALEELQEDINDLTAVDVANTPTTSLAATDVQGALNELQGEVDALSLGGSVGALTSPQRRKLTEIAEVGTATYANAPGANLARSNGASPPLPTGPFSHPFTGAGGRPFFFEVTDGTSITNAVISRRDSSGNTVGNPIDVSGATPQSTTDPAINRYLTPQAITVPTGGSLRLELATRTFTEYTLSGKYRIPSSGVTRVAAGNVNELTVEAALQGLQTKITTVSDGVSANRALIPSNAADIDVDATSIPNLAADNVQAALAEIQGDITGIQTAAAALDIPADAGDLSVTPNAALLATNVQDALVELQSEITAAAAVVAALDIPSDAGDIDSSVVGLAATNVQQALDQIHGITNGLASTIMALNASAVEFDPSAFTNLVSNNVQGAIIDVHDIITDVNDRLTGYRALVPDDASELIFSPTVDIQARTVQAAVVELQGEINTLRTAAAALVIPTDAEHITVDPSASGLVSTDVQDALEELQGKFEGVMALPGLSAETRRKLAAISERTTTVNTEPTVADPDSVTMYPAFTSTIPDAGTFVYPLPLPNPAGQHISYPIYINVDSSVITSLEDHYIERINISTGDANGTFDVSNAVVQTNNTISGRNVYVTRSAIPIRGGEELRLFRSDTVHDRYTLSNKYRLPAAGILGSVPATNVSVSTIASLTASNVQEALEALQSGGTGGSGTATLSEPDTRKLSNIVEATDYTYADKTDATLALGDPTPGTFTSTITRRTSAVTTRVYVEVPTGTDITELYLRHFDTNGDVETSTALTTLGVQSLPNAGKTRYRTSSNFTLSIGDTIHLQTRTASGRSYTLSDNYKVPAGGVTRTPTLNLAAEDVETALTSIQGELDGVVSVTPVQRNKLADISTSYALVTGSQVALANTSSPPAPMGAFEDEYRNAFNARVFFEVPTGVSVASSFLRVRDTVDNVVEIVDVSDAEEQTSANSGKDRYLTRQTLDVTPAQAYLDLYAPDRYALSNKYRIDAASVLNLPAPVPGPPGPAGTDGALSAVNTRKLADITEGTGYTYADVAGAQLAGQGSSGPGGFSAFISGLTSPDTTRIYFEIPAGESRTGMYLRHLRSDGTVASSSTTAVTGATTQTNPNTGKDRYRTVDEFDLRAGDTVRLQTRAISYDTYTLSDKYRIDATSILNLPAPVPGPAGADGVLSAANTRKLDGITEGSAVVHNDLTGGQLAFRDGNNPPTNFEPTLTPSVDQNTQIYIEVPTGTPLTGLTLRVFSQSGALAEIISFADAAPQNTASAQKDRYLTSESIDLDANVTVKLQLAETQYNLYTLSGEYRLPVAGLVGQIPAANILNTAQGKLTATNVQAALNELQTEINGLPVEEEERVFFDNMELTGNLSGLADATHFYYLPAANLPERDLSDWTEVNNGQFPQTQLSSAVDYVVLLAEKHPKQITWAPHSSQPAPGPSDPSITTVGQDRLRQVNGAQIPDNYRGWQFTMPAWNVASAAMTGARLQAGDLRDQDVTRIDIDSKVKITDSNLDLQNPTTVLSDSQHDKLQGLQLKTFDQGLVTEGKPSTAYDLLLASAWPDPDVIYYPGGTPSDQEPRYTGLRTVGSANTFFNLVTNNNVVLGAPTLPVSAVPSLIGLTTAGDRAACSAIRGGTIQARDRSDRSRMRIDDDEGLMATMTLHTPADLAAGDHPILNIGGENITGRQTLVLHKLANHPTDGGGLSLRVTELTGAASTTTETRDVEAPLKTAVKNTYTEVLHPSGSGAQSLDSTWVIPSDYTTTSSAYVTYQLFIRVWKDGQDQGEHEFTSAIPSAFQTMGDYTTAIASTSFTLPFGTAGFSGLGDTQMQVDYDPPGAEGSSSANTDRRLNLRLQHPSNTSGYIYVVRVNAVRSQSVTIPGGSTSPVDMGAIPAGGVHEIGFYARSALHSDNSRGMRYWCSVNGAVTHSAEGTGSGSPPTGSVPVTFGAGTGSSLAVNRFTIVKPKMVLTAAQMNELTTVSLRNRNEVGGLIRHSGGTFREAFSPAYRSTMFTSDTAQNLPHPATGSSSGSTGLAEPAYVHWTNANILPELSIASTTSELQANTNFTASVTLDVGVLFDSSFIVPNQSLAAGAFFLLKGRIQEKIGSGDWTPVPGPLLASEILMSTVSDGLERPADLVEGNDALVRRALTTVINFKQGASYRAEITGYRLLGYESPPPGNALLWSQDASLIQLAANKTFLMLNITPTV